MWASYVHLGMMIIQLFTFTLALVILIWFQSQSSEGCQKSPLEFCCFVSFVWSNMIMFNLCMGVTCTSKCVFMILACICQFPDSKTWYFSELCMLRTSIALYQLGDVGRLSRWSQQSLKDKQTNKQKLKVCSQDMSDQVQLQLCVTITCMGTLARSFRLGYL